MSAGHSCLLKRIGECWQRIFTVLIISSFRFFFEFQIIQTFDRWCIFLNLIFLIFEYFEFFLHFFEFCHLFISLFRFCSLMSLQLFKLSVHFTLFLIPVFCAQNWFFKDFISFHWFATAAPFGASPVTILISFFVIYQHFDEVPWINSKFIQLNCGNFVVHSQFHLSNFAVFTYFRQTPALSIQENF